MNKRFMIKCTACTGCCANGKKCSYCGAHGTGEFCQASDCERVGGELRGKETPPQWEDRHKDHVTEEWTPERPFETRSLYCHDCNESAEWKGNKKIDREKDSGQ